MEDRHRCVGTRARADRVDNQNLLFPNGYDRTQNTRTQPLVTVRDTAEESDDFLGDEFDFDDGSPSENVTVTIRMASDNHSVETNTTSGLMYRKRNREERRTNDSDPSSPESHVNNKDDRTGLNDAKDDDEESHNDRICSGNGNISEQSIISNIQDEDKTTYDTASDTDNSVVVDVTNAEKHQIDTIESEGICCIDDMELQTDNSMEAHTEEITGALYNYDSKCEADDTGKDEAVGGEDVQKVGEEDDIFIGEPYTRGNIHDNLYEEYEQYIEIEPSEDLVNMVMRQMEGTVIDDAACELLHEETTAVDNSSKTSAFEYVGNVESSSGTRPKQSLDDRKVYTEGETGVSPVWIEESPNNKTTASHKPIVCIDLTGKTPEKSMDTDRSSSMMSPKTGTPIVIETSSSSTDDGEDFMEYLRQLRGAAADISDTVDNKNGSENYKKDVNSHDNNHKAVTNVKSPLKQRNSLEELTFSECESESDEEKNNTNLNLEASRDCFHAEGGNNFKLEETHEEINDRVNDTTTLSTVAADRTVSDVTDSHRDTCVCDNFEMDSKKETPTDDESDTDKEDDDSDVDQDEYTGNKYDGTDDEDDRDDSGGSTNNGTQRSDADDIDFLDPDAGSDADGDLGDRGLDEDRCHDKRTNKDCQVLAMDNYSDMAVDLTSIDTTDICPLEHISLTSRQSFSSDSVVDISDENEEVKQLLACSVHSQNFCSGKNHFKVILTDSSDDSDPASNASSYDTESLDDRVSVDNLDDRVSVDSLDDGVSVYFSDTDSEGCNDDDDFDSALERRFWTITVLSSDEMEEDFSSSCNSPMNGYSSDCTEREDSCNSIVETFAADKVVSEFHASIEDIGDATSEYSQNGHRLTKNDQSDPNICNTLVTLNSEDDQSETSNIELRIRKQKFMQKVCEIRRKRLLEFVPMDVRPHYGGNTQVNVKDKLVECEIKQIIDGVTTEKESKADSDQVLTLGRGFYILGTADMFNLPLGPMLKKEPRDTEVCRPSMYFRGVPGILHNAYKMSSNFTFPKLSVPRDSSSHKILHACNRLASKLSPLQPMTKEEIQHGMMQQDKQTDQVSDDDSSGSVDLSDLLTSARDFLNSSRFDDAEAMFLKLYKELQEKPEENNRLLVETLTGLADICIRRSRMCRSNPLEWQWLCMHAIALLQYTSEFCESELEEQLDNEVTEWFTEQKQAAELKCRPLEDAFLRALYNCLKHDANFFDPFQSFSLPNTPVSQNRKMSLFPLSSTMPQYLLVPGMRYRITEKGLTKQSSDDNDVAIDWLAKFQHYCKDRLLTKDSRGVTEKILKSTKSKATDEDETQSVLSDGSHGSLDWDHSDLQGVEEVETEEVEKDNSPLRDYSFELELANSDSENEGWDFFLHQRRNCCIQSVVQVAAEGKSEETEKDNILKETKDTLQHEKTKRKYVEPRDIVSPLHEHSISLTLARSFCRLADKLVHEEEYKKAEAVYEKILDIIDNIQDGTAGMLRFSARIMKNLGTVKSKQGKSSSGLVLLNKALNTYRDLQDEEANFEIAVALIELGNGYIVGQNHEDSVFDDVIIAICDFFEKDASDSQSVSTSSSGSASHISQMTSSLGSNTDERNVEEALMCYTEAITLLDRYEADGKQVDMFAKSVMRLGDCHFMQKDYDKALECYERALGMFRTNNLYGKDSLMENAHVLCMLGVSSFMLHVYPRAASVFEMALHMVKCAYGFKRTFLNGMLQSLAGITYYKMKNYHKCVTMCYQAYDTYCDIFGEGMSRLDKQKFWLVCQTLYVMGNSYNILNLQSKAMKYLAIARSLMKSSKCRERRQFMRVLQILGDSYFAQYDYKTALSYYNEALEYGECESQISFDEVFDPNCASDEMTIHNHLVSKSAEAHLSMQQYQNAVHYLEQAHDMQEVMGEDIKEDLINTLNQLGHMHSVAGDIDKAIESYKEALEVFREIHNGELGPAMCVTLGNLAAISYVKACLSDSPVQEHAMIAVADCYFQDAMQVDANPEVCVKYGNFLFSQCNYEKAVVYLREAMFAECCSADIVYGGIEKVTLPELLQDEVDTQEEICLPTTCLARYLLIIAYKALHFMDDAEITLIHLMEDVNDYDVPLLHSLLGYAMMEMSLFEEAAICFYTAADIEEDYQLAAENFTICLMIIALNALKVSIDNILDYAMKQSREYRSYDDSANSFLYLSWR